MASETKTIDVEKVREAIKILKDAREVLDEIEGLLPREKETIPCTYYPIQVHWEYPHRIDEWPSITYTVYNGEIGFQEARDAFINAGCNREALIELAKC